jgi:hypothetical protein
VVHQRDLQRRRLGQAHVGLSAGFGTIVSRGELAS